MRWLLLATALVSCTVAVEDYQECEYDLDAWVPLSCTTEDLNALIRCQTEEMSCRETCAPADTMCVTSCSERNDECQDRVFASNPSCATCYQGSLLKCYSDGGCAAETQAAVCCSRCAACDCAVPGSDVTACIAPIQDECLTTAFTECFPE